MKYAIFLLMPILICAASWQKLSVTGTAPGKIAWTTGCYVNSWKKLFIFGNGAGTSESQGPCYKSRGTGGGGYLNTEHTFDYATKIWSMIRDDHDVTNYQTYIETRKMNDAMTWPAVWPGEPPGRDNHQMVYDPILDNVYMLGGTCSGGFWMYHIPDRKWYILSSKGLYTDLPLLPETDTYYKSVNAVGEVFNCAMVFDYLKRRVIIHGGRLGSQCPFFDRTYAFDCIDPQATQRWERVAQNSQVQPGSYGKNENCAVYDPVGQKMIFFGGSGQGWCGESYMTGTWELDCKTDTWQKITSSPQPPLRDFGNLVYDPYHRRAFLQGGDCGGSATWAYDPAAQTWAQIASGPSNVRFSVGGYDLHNRRFIHYTAGGETWALTYEDGQEYDPIPYPGASVDKQVVNKKLYAVIHVCPNPFYDNTMINIEYRMSNIEYRNFKVGIFNLKGQLIENHSFDIQPSSFDVRHSFSWNPVQLPPGIYFIYINAGEISFHKSVIILK